MKKHFSLLLSIMITLVMLSGCGNYEYENGKSAGYEEGRPILSAVPFFLPARI